jgi:hypothetical protein
MLQRIFSHLSLLKYSEVVFIHISAVMVIMISLIVVYRVFEPDVIWYFEPRKIDPGFKIPFDILTRVQYIIWYFAPGVDFLGVQNTIWHRVRPNQKL